MKQNSDNRKRAFADVVTIEAWHKSFSEKKQKVDLCADVVFGTARIGGEIDSPVRFRLRVKRAEVIIIVPDSEPVSIDKDSVSRDSPEFEGQFTETTEQQTKASKKAKLSASVAPNKLGGSLNAEVGAQADLSSRKKLSVTGKVQFMIVTQSKTDDGHYRWLVEPQSKSFLDGRPWHPKKQPRLKLIDERKDRKKGIPPTVRVEVRCRREDLLIEDLKTKDKNLWEAFKTNAGFKNKIAAAESYIRDRLSEEGLDVKNISEMFGQVTLASTTAETT